MSSLQVQSLHTAALAMFETSRGIFWSFLPIVFLLAIMAIFLSGEISGGSFEKLIKRTVIAILLLYAFPMISDTMANLDDYLVNAFGGQDSLMAIFSKVADHAQEIKNAGTSNWFKFAQMGLTIIATLSFLILSLVEHFLDVLHLTIWNLLHILGPIALLGCLFPSFSQIPRGIFMGLFELSLWRPVWVILGRILIAIGFGDAPPDPSQWFDTAIMNFSVAALMASTPALVHGFLSGTLASIGGSAVQSMVGGAAGMLAGAPMMMAKKAASFGNKAAGTATSGAWTVAGGKWAAHEAKPHISRARNYVAEKMPAYWNPDRKNKNNSSV